MSQRTVVEGDLLDQPTEAIVNAWNRNVIPWWLLIPQGVSGAIKRRGGLAPFRELGRMGPIPLGGAVATGAGRLPHRSIIHVAAINLIWRASSVSIADATRNALDLAEGMGLRSVAFPILGTGSGGFRLDEAERIMAEVIDRHPADLQVTLVRFRRAKTPRPPKDPGGTGRRG